MFCLTLEPSHYKFIKELGYIPVGLGDKNFDENWFSDRSGTNISKRNKKISSQLSKKSKKIIVLKDNQEIINNSNWIFLSITPEVGSKIIKNLKFKSSQTIINFISTIGIAQLKKYIKVKATIVRALPLPPIALRKGPVPICPANKKAKFFFDHLGTTVEVSSEKLFTNFWCMTAMMAPF